jgi:hypothetical protein
MKKLLFFLIPVVSISLCLFACKGGEQMCCYPKKQFKEYSWYKHLLLLLNQEYKIDSIDAYSIKMLSSTIIFNEKPLDVVKKYGKIEEADIKLICNMKESNDSIIYIFTQTSVYIQLFTYTLSTNKLIRITKKGSIVVTGAEELSLKENNDSSMILWTPSKIKKNNGEGWWARYFYYDKKASTFYHFKNCRIMNGQEECKTISN